MEGLLTKPPFYTQQILNELLEDISEAAPALNSREKVKKYVESRYFSRITPSVELNIFRSLWKLVFKVEDSDCNKNRLINLHVIEVLSTRNTSQIHKTISGDKDYYSNIAPTGSPLAFLVFYLSKNPSFYPLLNKDAQLKINHSIESDPIGKTCGWFVKNSLATHAEDIINWIKSDVRLNFTSDQLDTLLQISDTEEWQEHFCTIISTYYRFSKNYDQADARFQVAIPNPIHNSYTGILS